MKLPQNILNTCDIEMNDAKQDTIDVHMIDINNNWTSNDMNIIQTMTTSTTTKITGKHSPNSLLEPSKNEVNRTMGSVPNFGKLFERTF